MSLWQNKPTFIVLDALDKQIPGLEYLPQIAFSGLNRHFVAREYHIRNIPAALAHIFISGVYLRELGDTKTLNYRQANIKGTNNLNSSLVIFLSGSRPASVKAIEMVKQG